MKILVTGAGGFIGKNLTHALKNRGYGEILEYRRGDGEECLEEYCRICEFVFHLAGVNRPENPEEFHKGNTEFTKQLTFFLQNNNNSCPVIYSSSIQAERDNPYGISKKAGENILIDHARKIGSMVRIYRLPNVFGKWCRPDYNSVVATFCHRTACGEEIQVHDPHVTLKLLHIDDLITDFLEELHEQEDCPVIYRENKAVHTIELGEAANLIQSFASCNSNHSIPDLSDPLTRKLYSAYISYVPANRMKYPLVMHCDDRGSFTEVFRTKGQGQISINISKPSVTKGNHWHDTKHEKFLVVKGEGVVRLRRADESEIIEIPVSGQRLEVVEIPSGYTHNIENTGRDDLITLMWANENFDMLNPDTHSMEV